jgi:hypothetical protein
LLAPFLAPSVLTLSLRAISLLRYMSINRKHLSATATFSAHFEPPGNYQLKVQST